MPLLLYEFFRIEYFWEHHQLIHLLERPRLTTTPSTAIGPALVPPERFYA
jgi:hypothetical protein